MKQKSLTRHTTPFILAALMLFVPANFYAGPVNAIKTPNASAQINVGMNGFFSVDKLQRGNTVQAAVVLDVPSGFHINSSRPLNKMLIPTKLRVDVPRGLRISPISYPRAALRRFSFSDEQLAVYEGRVVMRFNITVPANYQLGTTQLRVRLNYQGCNDEACFPPKSSEITLPIAIVGADESVKRINGQLFNGRRRR